MRQPIWILLTCSCFVMVGCSSRSVGVGDDPDAGSGDAATVDPTPAQPDPLPLPEEPSCPAAGTDALLLPSEVDIRDAMVSGNGRLAAVRTEGAELWLFDLLSGDSRKIAYPVVELLGFSFDDQVLYYHIADDNGSVGDQAMIRGYWIAEGKDAPIAETLAFAISPHGPFAALQDGDQTAIFDQRTGGVTRVGPGATICFPDNEWSPEEPQPCPPNFFFTRHGGLYFARGSLLYRADLNRSPPGVQELGEVARWRVDPRSHVLLCVANVARDPECECDPEPCGDCDVADLLAFDETTGKLVTLAEQSWDLMRGDVAGVDPTGKVAAVYERGEPSRIVLRSLQTGDVIALGGELEGDEPAAPIFLSDRLLLVWRKFWTGSKVDRALYAVSLAPLDGPAGPPQKASTQVRRLGNPTDSGLLTVEHTASALKYDGPVTARLMRANDGALQAPSVELAKMPLELRDALDPSGRWAALILGNDDPGGGRVYLADFDSATALPLPGQRHHSLRWFDDASLLVYMQARSDPSTGAFAAHGQLFVGEAPTQAPQALGRSVSAYWLQQGACHGVLYADCTTEQADASACQGRQGGLYLWSLGTAR